MGAGLRAKWGVFFGAVKTGVGFGGFLGDIIVDGDLFVGGDCACWCIAFGLYGWKGGGRFRMWATGIANPKEQ